MQELDSSATSVERVSLNKVSHNNGKHILARFKINELNKDNPEFVFSPGEVGMRNILCINPVPVGMPFSAVWNGDTKNPSIRFDGWPGESFEMILDCWGL